MANDDRRVLMSGGGLVGLLRTAMIARQRRAAEMTLS
jgi:hypothetical protein